MNLKNTKWMGLIMLLSLLMTGISFGERGYDLDEFDDLELESLDRQKKKTTQRDDKGQRLILFDDNLYLLDDEFDFGNDEIELQKLELNPDDMETAKEYEDFLNAFFENSIPVGNNQLGGSVGNKQFGGQKKSTGRKKSDTSSMLSKSKRSSTGRQNTRTPSFQAPVGRFGFGVSTMFGVSIPMGENLKSNFSSGSNFGIHLDTPLSFNVGSMEAKVGAELYFSEMKSVNTGGSPYKLANIAGTISLFPLKSLEIKAGLGLSPSNIGPDNIKTLPSGSVDINYYLPFSVKGFGIALNLHAQETLGIPTDIGTEDTQATSEFINVGFFITTPLVF